MSNFSLVFYVLGVQLSSIRFFIKSKAEIEVVKKYISLKILFIEKYNVFPFFRQKMDSTIEKIWFPGSNPLVDPFCDFLTGTEVIPKRALFMDRNKW